MATPKQRKIIAFAAAHDHQITTDQAVEIIGGTYYHNDRKHTGEVLSRMVKAGLLLRLKPGHFQLIPKTIKQKVETANPSQINLF